MSPKPSPSERAALSKAYPAVSLWSDVTIAREAVLKKKSYDAALDLQKAQKAHRGATKLKLADI